MPRWPKTQRKKAALTPQPATQPAAESATSITLATQTLDHVSPVSKMFDIHIYGPDGKLIARYKNIPGYTRQEAIRAVNELLLLQAHPS